MSSTANLDALIARAWPAIEIEGDRGWLLRFASGATQRANSALAIGGTEREFPDRLAKVEAFYRDRGARPLILVSEASAPEGLAAFLVGHSYESISGTLVMAADTERVAIEPPVEHWEVRATSSLEEDWFATYWKVESRRGWSDAQQLVYRERLLVPELATTFVSVLDHDQVIGVGQLVLEEGWAGLQCIATDPDRRREGVGQVVLHALAAQARDLGAESLYLAVAGDNKTAVSLYRRLGFEPHHAYCYFRFAEPAVEVRGERAGPVDRPAASPVRIRPRS